jgi:hypothetical protein
MPCVVRKMQEQESRLLLVLDAKIQGIDAKGLAGLHATFIVGRV